MRAHGGRGEGERERKLRRARKREEGAQAETTQTANQKKRMQNKRGSKAIKLINCRQISVNKSVNSIYRSINKLP